MQTATHPQLDRLRSHCSAPTVTHMSDVSQRTPCSPPLPALFATSCPALLPPDLQAIAALVSSSSSSASSSCSSSSYSSPPPSSVSVCHKKKRPPPLGPVAQANLFREHASASRQPSLPISLVSPPLQRFSPQALQLHPRHPNNLTFYRRHRARQPARSRARSGGRVGRVRCKCEWRCCDHIIAAVYARVKPLTCASFTPFTSPRSRRAQHQQQAKFIAQNITKH
jgi:hypothetical protein